MKEIIETLRGADNEGTAEPWWAIVDPRQAFKCNPHEIASMITGPFFSRKDATDFLKATRYNFGKYAVVYCFSGYYSKKYREFYRNEIEGKIKRL
jgi:hypothetical protein